MIKKEQCILTIDKMEPVNLGNSCKKTILNKLLVNLLNIPSEYNIPKMYLPICPQKNPQKFGLLCVKASQYVTGWQFS